MDCSTPRFSAHHLFPELTQTHVHRDSDAIQPRVWSPGNTEGLTCLCSRRGSLITCCSHVAKATSPTGLSFSSTSPSSSMINIPVGGGQPEGEDNDSTMYILETWTLFTQPPTNANHLCVCSVAQPCLTFYDPVDYKIHIVFQARILQWVAFPFSKGYSQPGDRTQVSHIAGRFFTS